jgi:hypothetical protein
MSYLERRVFDENRRKLLFSSGVGGSGRAPIEGEQGFDVSSAEGRGKAPPITSADQTEDIRPFGPSAGFSNTGTPRISQGSLQDHCLT